MSKDLREILAQPKAAIMGVVNTTPDSFSDGGRFLTQDAAVEHALQLVRDGADILDIGGESTRPGAEPVSVEDEKARVIPVIQTLVCETSTPISIDTSKPKVMRAALQAGASMINDVNGLRAKGAMNIAAESSCMLCIMHMQGQPRTMQSAPKYNDVVLEVITFLQRQIEACTSAGVTPGNIAVDPGIGFGKTLEHNLALLAATQRIKSELESHVLIGVSRKSMIDKLLGRPVDQRLAGSIGLAVQAVLNGAKIIRVHDVAATHDAVRCAEAVAAAQTK